LNNRGVIVGAILASGSISIYQPFVFENGVLTRLPTLVPGGSAFGADINDEGMIAGYADTEAPRSPSTPHHAILINAGQVLDLGVLPGFTLSSANRINRHG